MNSIFILIILVWIAEKETNKRSKNLFVALIVAFAIGSFITQYSDFKKGTQEIMSLFSQNQK